MSLIDLKDLAVRENERVEWKENVADINDVVKTVTALANDFSNLGGGYVVCGAREGQDEHGFQKVFYTPSIGVFKDRGGHGEFDDSKAGKSNAVCIN